MRNNESYGGGNEGGATKWDILKENKPTALSEMREELEDLARSDYYGKLESDYDDKVRAREEAIKKGRDEWENAPKTALDYANEDLEELEGDNYYGRLRSDYDEKIRKRAEAIKAEREAWENAPQTPLGVMNEDLEDLQYGPVETNDNEVTSEAGASRKSNVRAFFRNNSPLGKESLESAEATESYRIPNGGEVNKSMTDAGASEGVTNSGSKANESFKSKNLAWPEKTTDEVMDDAMGEAEDAIENAEEALDTQTAQHEEPKEPAWGKHSKIGELKPDEVEEINRTIAKMAEDEKLKGIMMQKEYESEADHAERLVRMAKTELRWQKLKNAFNESAKHQREDNAKLEKMRERIARARSVVGNIRIGKPSAEATNEAKATSAKDTTNEVKTTSAKDAPSAGLIDVENEQRHMQDELAQDIQTMMGAKGDGGENTGERGRTGNITRVKEATRGEATRDFKVINMPEEIGKKTPETTPRGISMDNLRENFLAEMARRGVKLDEKSDQMKTLKRAEASREFKPTNMPEEGVGQTTEEAPQREIVYGELKNRVMEELARRGMSSEKLEKAKSVLSEYQRQVEHVDDKLNAERDKIVEGKPRSIRGRLKHIFGSLAEKRKEKRRKQEEEDRRIFNSWEDDVY